MKTIINPPENSLKLKSGTQAFLLYLLLFSLFWLLPHYSAGQIKHDYVWVMGTNGLPSDTTASSATRFGVNILNFNNGELNIKRVFQDTDFDFANASMSNAGGKMLFTSNGCSVFQADGEVMENGTGINPGVAYSTGFCPQQGYPMVKGMLVLPFPGSDSLYCLFHKAVVLGDASPFSVYNGIVYSTVVDMSANNGLGAVVEKNNIVLEDTLLNDMHAVRHANGIDWWVISSSSNKNTYFTMLFTADGVSGVFEQEIGPSSVHGINGMSVFSPDGNRFARYDRGLQVMVFDFDRETGQLSNLTNMIADTVSNASGGTIAFSPSSRFLYVASNNELYQFDLEAAEIQSSRVLLDVYDGYKYLDIFPASFGFMQLAPNCRIYMSTRSATPFYHVINYPDRKGHECGFVQRGQPLIATNIGSIPNNPNYNLGTGFPVCDSTIQLVVSSVPVLPPRQEVLVYPNPASSYIIVEMPQPLTANSEWSLYNAVGQRVVSKVLERGFTMVQVWLPDVAPGLYFWEVTGEGGRFGSGKLVVTQ